MESIVGTLGDRGVYALEREPGSGDLTVVLAHGINADHTEDRSASKPGLFDVIVDRLSTHGIGTIRFDFRGHGQSDPVDGYVSISSEVEDLERVLEYASRAGRNVVALVGCSFGACATSVVVAKRMAMVENLVLLNPVVRPRETFLEPGSDWARQSFTPEALAALGSGAPLMLDGDFPLGQRFVDDVATIEPTELLRNYKGKLAIVHGTLDTYVPFEYSRHFANEMKSTFVAVTGSEHGFGNMDARNFVAGFVGDYLCWAVR
jgi:hypothetical protein